MRTIALILTVFSFILVSSQETIRESRLNFRNLLSNPGAENGKSGVAVSNPAHLSISSVAANVSEGKSSFDWQPTAATNSIVFGVADFPQEYANASCLAKGMVRAGGNYSAGLLAIRVKSNGVAYTDDLDIGPVSTGDWKPFEIAFICPAYGSGALDIEFEVTAGSVWKIDSLWLGKDYRLGQTPFEGWRTYTESDVSITSSQGGWAVDQAALTPYKDRDGNWRLNFNIEGSYTAATINTITIILSGVTFSTTFVQSISALPFSAANVTSTKGATTSGSNGLVWAGTSSGNTTGVAFSGDIQLTSKPTWAKDFLPKETVTLETQGWFVEGEIFGTTAISLVLGNVTSWAEATRSDLALDLTPNSKNAQIACAAGNPSTGLTCAAGNETMGVTVEVPYAGLYEACFNINQDQNALTSIRTVWAVHETEENSLTILQSGLTRNYIGQGNTAGETRTVNSKPCGIFNFTAGRHTIRALYMQQGSGVVSSAVVVDRSATVGERNLSFFVRPYTQNFPQAVALPKADWQKRFLQSDIINTNTPDISDLRFTGLETNKLYKICYQARMQISGNSASEIAQLNAKHNGATIAIVEFRDDAGPIETRRQSAGTCTIFKALTNTLVFEHIVNGTVTVISGSSSTFAILEELPWHNNETTKWTP